MFAVAMVAATTMAVGSLAAAPSASAAMNLSCNQALALFWHYEALGDAYSAVGNNQMAGYWYGRADGMIDAYC